MHATYSLINIVFLLPLAGMMVFYWRTMPKMTALLTLGSLCLLTAIFDNVIIALGIVAYDPATLSGIMIGRAPLEDFTYTLTAVLLVAIIWERRSNQ